MLGDCQLGVFEAVQSWRCFCSVMHCTTTPLIITRMCGGIGDAMEDRLDHGVQVFSGSPALPHMQAADECVERDSYHADDGLRPRRGSLQMQEMRRRG